jgi:uncharacterized protein (TIGR03067 family)
MMRLVVSAAALLFGAAVLADDKKAGRLPEGAKKELARLQGEWLAKEFGRYGRKLDVRGEKLVLVIKDAKWIFTDREKGEFIAIDPKADPKSFDLQSVEAGRKGEVDEAIYKLDGDTLTVCLYQGKDKRRPAKFETGPEQPDTILMVFERVKKK